MLFIYYVTFLKIDVCSFFVKHLICTHIDERQRLRTRIYVVTRTMKGTCRWHSSNLPAVLCRLINRLPDYHALQTVTTVKERGRERERKREKELILTVLRASEYN